MKPMKPTNRNIVSTQVYSALATIALFLSAILPAPAATDTWTGTTDNNWADANWTGGNSTPQSGDSLVFGGTGIGTLSDNLGGALTTYGITFNSSAYNSGGYTINTPNGSSIFLSGQSSGNSTGIANSSTGLQTVNLNLNLDWGYYTFSSSSGGTLALGGTPTLNSGGAINTIVPNAGGVACLDGSVSFPNLVADPTTGLIPGLEAGGLFYSGGVPTGLATINGSGNVIAYPSGSYNSFATGAISGNNVYLSAAGATGTYTAASGLGVNTITVAQTGNVATGADITTTLTLAGTLTVSGIYVPFSTSTSGANHADFTLTGGTLTAGTAGVGGTIVFVVNGNNPKLQATISSAIDDNGSGKVSVITAGTGSINPNSSTSTFSGGLYVTQGFWEGNTVSIGKGSVYVASNATMLLNASGTYANNFYLSPGPGSSLFQGSTTPNPGAILGSPTVANNTYSGTFTLLGAPVTWPAAGCRLTGNNGNVAGSDNYNLTGQISGTGTLDLNADNLSTEWTLANSSANNNWTGGLILEASSASASVSPALTNLIKMGAGSQIPSSGNVTLASVDSSPAYVILDMLNSHQTINGLSSYYDPGNAVLSLSAEQSYTQYFLITNSGAIAGGVLTLGAGPNNTAGTSFTYGGTLTDGAYFVPATVQPARAISLVKTGVGTQIFNGPVNIAGSTTINGGTFELAGSGVQIPYSTPIAVASGATLDASERSDGTLTLSSSSPVFLSGQTLMGSGTVIGTLAVASGSTVAEGSSTTIGTLANTGSTQLQSGGTNVVKVQDAMGGAGIGNDLLAVSGNINVTATSANPFTITLTSLNAGAPGNAANFNNTTTYTWTIATGTVTGFSGSAFTVNTNGFSNPLGGGWFFVGSTGTSLVLVFEPAANGLGSIITPSVNGNGNPTFSGNGNGVPGGGYIYGVESATSVTGPWIEAGTVTTLANGSWSFTDLNQMNPPTIFYRLYYPDNPGHPPQ